MDQMDQMDQMGWEIIGKSKTRKRRGVRREVRREEMREEKEEKEKKEEKEEKEEEVDRHVEEEDEEQGEEQYDEFIKEFWSAFEKYVGYSDGKMMHCINFSSDQGARTYVQVKAKAKAKARTRAIATIGPRDSEQQVYGKLTIRPPGPEQIQIKRRTKTRSPRFYHGIPVTFRADLTVINDQDPEIQRHKNNEQCASLKDLSWIYKKMRADVNGTKDYLWYSTESDTD
jgi:hypothetical protein